MCLGGKAPINPVPEGWPPQHDAGCPRCHEAFLAVPPNLPIGWKARVTPVGPGAHFGDPICRLQWGGLCLSGIPGAGCRGDLLPGAGGDVHHRLHGGTPLPDIQLLKSGSWELSEVPPSILTEKQWGEHPDSDAPTQTWASASPRQWCTHGTPPPPPASALSGHH